MKLSDAAKVIPLLQAVLEGKVLQGRNSSCADGWQEYTERENFSLTNVDNYRIKPERKLRAWTAEEVPVGAWLRVIEDKDSVGIITAKNKFRCVVGHTEVSNSSVFSLYQHSTNNGLTWKPCGVEE